MNWNTNVQRFLLPTSLTILALLVGCSSQGSGGDITLASPNQRSSVTPSTRNVVNTAATTTPAPSPTNFQTGSGATINIGTQYNENSTAATPTTPVVSAQSVTQPTPLRAPVALPAAPTATVVTNTTPQAGVNTRPPATTRSAPATVDTPQGIQPSKKQVIAQTKPGCTGKQCPSIKLERLIFTEHERFSAFVEQSLLSMAQIESNQAKNFETLKQLSDYFWATARPRDEILLRATLKRATPTIVVVQLDSYIYSGGAHGNSTTQYLNWLPQSDIVVNLQTMIPSDNMPAFESALKRQHARWLQTNDLAKADPQAYAKLWPFRLSENAALLAEGIAITYDPYEIGPYALGMPTLTVPYSDLQGILRPELMPR
jgi:hypothetical protein